MHIFKPLFRPIFFSVESEILEKFFGCAENRSFESFDTVEVTAFFFRRIFAAKVRSRFVNAAEIRFVEVFAFSHDENRPLAAVFQNFDIGIEKPPDDFVETVFGTRLFFDVDRDIAAAHPVAEPAVVAVEIHLLLFYHNYLNLMVISASAAMIALIIQKRVTIFASAIP